MIVAGVLCLCWGWCVGAAAAGDGRQFNLLAAACVWITSAARTRQGSWLLQSEERNAEQEDKGSRTTAAAAVETQQKQHTPPPPAAAERRRQARRATAAGGRPRCVFFRAHLHALVVALGAARDHAPRDALQRAGIGPAGLGALGEAGGARRGAIHQEAGSGPHAGARPHQARRLAMGKLGCRGAGSAPHGSAQALAPHLRQGRQKRSSLAPRCARAAEKRRGRGLPPRSLATLRRTSNECVLCLARFWPAASILSLSRGAGTAWARGGAW